MPALTLLLHPHHNTEKPASQPASALVSSRLLAYSTYSTSGPQKSGWLCLKWVPRTHGPPVIANECTSTYLRIDLSTKQNQYPSSAARNRDCNHERHLFRPSDCWGNEVPVDKTPYSKLPCDVRYGRPLHPYLRTGSFLRVFRFPRNPRNRRFPDGQFALPSIMRYR